MSGVMRLLGFVFFQFHSAVLNDLTLCCFNNMAQKFKYFILFQNQGHLPVEDVLR